MKRVRAFLLIAVPLLVIGGLFAAGCWFDIGIWHPAGYATVRWTIDGQVDPAACARRGADRTEVRAVDAWGDTRALTTRRCEAFEETIAVRGGWYHAELTMVDDRGRAVSNTLRTETFRVVHRESIVVAPVDFRGCPLVVSPAPSFCATRAVIVRRDGAGCVAGYDCVIDGGTASACEAAGGRCVGLVPGACDRWGDPAACGAALGVGCCLSILAQ